MHKLCICLTKAQDRDDAISNVESFLEDYGDGNVWDWYVIGGRWSGTLNEKSKEFFEKAEEFFNNKYPETKDFISTQMVEDSKTELEKIWVEIGGIGSNPYNRDQYKNDGALDDAMPLKDCVAIVDKYFNDYGNFEEKAEEYWAKMLAEREKEKAENNTSTMSAYYAKQYAKCKYDDFSDISTVFDIVNYTNDISTAKENIDEYYAVVVDLHN